MTIIATPKDPNANSFVDVIYATSYLATRYNAEAWTDFDLSKKESLLATATSYINQYRYAGKKTDNDQSLEWPRNYVYDNNGNLVDKDVNPLNVKQATCEMALWIWTESDRLMSDIELQQINSMKVGPLNVTVNGAPITIPPLVKQLLSNIGPSVLLSTDSTSSGQVSICR